MKSCLLPLLLMGFVASARQTQQQQQRQQLQVQHPHYNKTESAFVKQQKRVRVRCRRCGCTIFPPFSIISSGKTKKRTEEFGRKMANCKLSLPTEVDYSPEGAFELLKLVTAGNPSYDGFRAYFAIYPCKRQLGLPDSGYQYIPKGKEGTLTLIYVPTWKDGKRHLDDTTYCEVILGKNIENVKSTYASMWILKAQNQVLNPMEVWYRNHVDTGFREAHSLWYSNFFVHHWDSNNGLIDILQCRMCCKSVKTVRAEFAGFLTKNHNHLNHQLSLVFQLSTKSAVNNISLQWDDLSDWAEYTFADQLKAYTTSDSGGSDTGNPCPPPKPCNSATGALLPSPNN